jgi:hypothetical protein
VPAHGRLDNQATAREQVERRELCGEQEWMPVRGDRGFGGIVIAAILGIAITGAAIFGSFYKVPRPTILAPIYALVWAALGLVYMIVVKGREPASDALADLRSTA